MYHLVNIISFVINVLMCSREHVCYEITKKVELRTQSWGVNFLGKAVTLDR